MIRKIREFLKTADKEVYRVKVYGCMDDVGVFGPTLLAQLRNLDVVAEDEEDDYDVYLVKAEDVREILEQVEAAIEDFKALLEDDDALIGYGDFSMSINHGKNWIEIEVETEVMIGLAERTRREVLIVEPAEEAGA